MQFAYLANCAFTEEEFSRLESDPSDSDVVRLPAAVNVVPAIGWGAPTPFVVPPFESSFSADDDLNFTLFIFPKVK